ncbi:MAG: site-2 protease family protein [archaeon GBS-70-058]|mgnify:CR=1 FL=1|nr:site-2 protease family protein [Candidatus Culexarchaeum nevadense]
MISDIPIFLVYLSMFWAVLFILYRAFKLERYNVEIKPYLVLFWRTEKLNKFIFKIASYARRFWRTLFTIGVFLAIGEVLFIINFFIKNIISYYSRVGEVQPILPLIPGITISFDSLVYFAISVVLVFFFHEFAHGIAAFTENVNIKSVGILFAIFLGGGFVELDEGEMNSAKVLSKLRILASGSAANLITGIIALFIISNFSFFISPFYGSPSGVVVVEVIDRSPAQFYGIKTGDVILKINGIKVNDSLSFSNILSSIPANSYVTLTTLRGEIHMIGGAHPSNASKVFLGVRVFNYYPSFIPLLSNPLLPYYYYNLLNWFEVISLSAAFINMLPIPFFDGGRFFEVLLSHKTLNSKKTFFMGKSIGVGELFLEILKFTSLLLLLINVSQSLLLR